MGDAAAAAVDMLSSMAAICAAIWEVAVAAVGAAAALFLALGPWTTVRA